MTEPRVVAELSLRTRLALWLWTRGLARLGRALMPGPGQCHSYRIRIGVLVAMAMVITVAVGIGCAHASRTQDATLRTRNGHIEATLSHFPPVSIAGQVVTLTGTLLDRDDLVPCPSLTWTLPDGTRSTHVSDCEPGERASHVDRRRYRLPSGDHDFQIAFDYEGHEWRASDTVHVQ